jgi:hypothetical protein
MSFFLSFYYKVVDQSKQGVVGHWQGEELDPMREYEVVEVYYTAFDLFFSCVHGGEHPAVEPKCARVAAAIAGFLIRNRPELEFSVVSGDNFLWRDL